MPRNLLQWLLLILFFCTGALGCGSGDGSLDPDLEASLRGIVDDNMAEFGLPGVMAGVWIPGQGSLVIEDGVSDIETQTGIERSQHYRIGSVTKSFTVTVVLQLAAEGLLQLDDPVGQYLPGLQNGDATLEELANMRSGIFNYTEDPDFVTEFVSDFLRAWTDQEIVDFADGNAPYFPPDQGWHYSNTNTVLLGMVVEKVTGRPLGDVIQERVLSPLGLKNTSYPTNVDLPSPFVHGYGFDPLEDLSLANPTASSGSGAMISSLEDMKIWGEALGTGSLLDAQTQSARIASLRPIVFNPCDDQDPARPKVSCPEYDRYGMGIGEIDGWIGHTGEYVGYTNLVMYEPDSGAVVVIMTNLFGIGSHLPTEIFKEFAAVLNPRL